MDFGISLGRGRLSISPRVALGAAAKLWFVAAVIGQWMFAIYVAGFYGLAAAHGNWAVWNKVLPHGYESGNTTGNAMLGLHLLFACVITAAGPLQFVPGVRARFPIFHRWSGRAYVLIAFVMGATGLYLTLSGRRFAGDGYVSIVINALLIMLCATMAARYAMARRFDVHQRWAMRLFLLVNGVWFFRVGMMFWLIVNRGPVGFDPATFRGPFLTILGFGQYVLPLAILELYLFARDRGHSAIRVGVAATLFLFTIGMCIGVFGATMGLWVPRLSG